MALKKRTWVLAGLAGILVVVGGLVAALLLLVPTDTIGRIAAERASAALDRDVTFERVRLKLFPVPAVALENLTVARWRNSQDGAGDAPQPGAQPLAAVQRVELRPRILPLLRREAQIRSIVIDQPQFYIEVDGAADPVQSVQEGEGFWDDSAFRVDRFAIRDGTVEYVDITTGATARLEEIDQELRLVGEMREGELARLGLTGQLSALVTADMPDRLAVPVQDLPLRIEHDAVLDMATEIAGIERLAVTLQELTLEGSGNIESWSDPAARRVSIQLASSEADLEPILASLPDDLRSWPASAAAEEQWSATTGRGRLEATIDGRLGDGESPAIEGYFLLEGIALARGSDPVLTDLTGRVDFSNESASTNGVTGVLLGAPLRLGFSAQDWAAPVVDASIATQIDFARAAKLGLLPPEWTARGAPIIDLTLAGPVQEPTDLAVDGQISLGGVFLESPEWPAGVTVSQGVLEFAGSQIVGNDLSAMVGESDLRIDFAAEDWLPYAFGEETPTPRIAIEGLSRFLNLDALFPVDPNEPTYGQLFFARLANSEVAGMSATAAAQEAGLALPDLPALGLDGRFHVDRVLQKGSEIRDVDLEVGIVDRQIEVRNASFEMLDGGIRMAARLGEPTYVGDSIQSAPFTVSFATDEVEANSFLQRFTLFRDNLGGVLSLDGSLTMELDRNLLPDPATVTGGGNLAIAGGRLVNWSMVRALGDRLGVEGFDTINFRDWSGPFELVGSRIMLAESTLESGEIGARVGGSFEVSGQLDVAGTIYLPPSLTSRVGGEYASRLTSAAAGADGRVPVGIRFTGSARQPSVALDLTEAGTQLADQVREEVESEARERVETAVDELVGSVGIPPVESPAAVVDSARQRAEEAVVGRLQGLLGGRRAADPEPAEAEADSVEAAVEPDSAEAAEPEPEAADSAAPTAPDSSASQR
ncbi:MAG: AsmA family protein [Gemmatimonas sp.]|nr:AsmA family protein [Gemmatimonas sp.]